MRVASVQSGFEAKRARASCAARGFTLVELLATITILAAIGSVISSMIASSVDGYAEAVTQAQLHTELSIAIDRIDREMRKVQREAGVTVAPNITSMTATSINWNGNNTLYRSGSQVLLVESGGAARVLLDDVTSFNIQAYDESNAALAATLNDAQANAVRRLRISITLQRAGITETLHAKMYLRCTMEGA